MKRVMLWLLPLLLAGIPLLSGCLGGERVEGTVYRVQWRVTDREPNPDVGLCSVFVKGRDAEGDLHTKALTKGRRVTKATCYERNHTGRKLSFTVHD